MQPTDPDPVRGLAVPRTFGYASERRSSINGSGGDQLKRTGFEQTGQNLPGRAFRLDQRADDYIGVKDGPEHSLPAPSFALPVLRFIRGPFGLRLEAFPSWRSRTCSRCIRAARRICSSRSTGTTAASGLPLRSIINWSFRNATRFGMSPSRWRTSRVEIVSIISNYDSCSSAMSTNLRGRWW